MYLNCHTYYSLRYGTIKPEQLLAITSKNGLQTLALTDINNTSACLDFVRLSEKYDIKPVLGVDFRNGAQQQFVMLAKYSPLLTIFAMFWLISISPSRTDFNFYLQMIQDPADDKINQLFYRFRLVIKTWTGRQYGRTCRCKFHHIF